MKRKNDIFCRSHRKYRTGNMNREKQSVDGERRMLSSLKPGERAQLLKIPDAHPLWQRLIDWGFTHGTTIICLHISPLGDPTAYRIHEGVVALRGQDADDIPITPIPADAAVRFGDGQMRYPRDYDTYREAGKGDGGSMGGEERV